MGSEAQAKNTKWRHGPAVFKIPRFPEHLAEVRGLVPVRGVINLEVGEEVLLYLRTSNPLLRILSKMNPFRLRLNGGFARNEFGPLGFLLFWVPYDTSPENAIAIYDLYVNVSNKALMGMWMELAYQTHWHVFLLDEKNKQHNFWEITNTFRLNRLLTEINADCQDVPLVDFDRAKEKFIAETTLEALHAMTSRSEKDAYGKSVFDASNAVPSPPTYPNPLKNARLAAVIKESLSTHAKTDSVVASDYEREKFVQLTTELLSKIFVYLDVCHWINLRHVWLQSPKALPVYEKILDRLKFLAEEEAVICPLSVPIFEELMKQADPLSRAATANLMEIFSRGICVRSFKEALCEQWRNYSTGKVNPESKISGLITKIGFLLPMPLLERIFLTDETDGIWEKVSVDLRWNLTVDDYQRLVELGKTEKGDEPPFLAGWRGLPAAQRIRKSTFPELIKACRRDILEAYSKDLIGHEENNAPVIHLAEKIISSMEYGRLPCCEIVAGMCAAQVYRGSRIRENDVFDFIHAGAGIPCCRAYFCDRPMEHLLRNKPLQIDTHFEATISSQPEELLTYLQSIERLRKS